MTSLRIAVTGPRLIGRGSFHLVEAAIRVAGTGPRR